jgi:NAD(P)H-dependent FMN reductase
MNIVLISGSMNPKSHSRLLIEEADKALRALGVETRVIDLAKIPLPICDGGAAYEDPRVDELATIIKNADAILVGVAVYNYGVNAAVKNLLELTGSAWEDHVVGFLCAAGGRSSYMSVMNFANNLMLDFRCLILPRFIYAVGNDFAENGVSNPEIRERIDQLAEDAKRFAAFRESTRLIPARVA